MRAPCRLVNRDRVARSSGEDGVTLIEVVVALGIVVVSLLALLGEFTTYLHQQRTQKAHAYALRVATTNLEDARRLGPSNLSSGSVTTQSHDGVAYTTTVNLQGCGASISASSCKQLGVTVAWSDSSGAHHVDLSTADADTHQGSVAGSNGNLTTSSTGSTGTSVTLASFTASPSSVSVDGNNHPTSDITLALNVTGLSSPTSISATWNDDAGSHHATLTNAGGNVWSAVVPKAQVTRAVSGSSSTVTFAATVPGLSVMPTTTLTLVPAPTLSNCHVTAAPIVLVPLTRRTSLPEVLSCSASGLTGGDAVSASYASGTGSATVSMTTADAGATWIYTLPAGTSMVSSGSTEAFTFTLTRAIDGYTAATNLSASLG